MPIKLLAENDVGAVYRPLVVSPPRSMAPLDALTYSGRQLATGPALCMYVSEPNQLESIEATLGRPLDALLAFTDPANPITTNTFPFTVQWPGTRKLILSHCISVNGWDMAAAAAGAHDAEYAQAAANLVPYRDRILAIRIGWEFNAPGGFPWSIGGNGTNQTAANYAEAFRHFALEIRLAMPEVLIEWCPLWDQAAADTWYPGDEYVDVIGNDVYLKSAFWTDQFFDVLANAPCDLQWQEQFAQSHGKFMSIPEWGTDYNTGTWVTNMLAWMRRPRSARVLYQAYWNSTLSFDSSFANHAVNWAAYQAKLHELSGPPVPR